MEKFDVVVLGSGAAGMTAVLAAREAGATAALYEQADTVGGTSAVSGGVVWIPVHNLPFKGEPLSEARAHEYLDTICIGSDPEKIATYIATGQPLIDFIHKATTIRFTPVEGFPDYYPEQPGGALGGRSLDPSPYPFDELGVWAERVTRFPKDEFAVGFDYETQMRRVSTISAEDLAEIAQADGRFLGAGLIGGLLRAILDRGVEPQTGYRAVDLVIEDGAVSGVIFEHDGQSVEVGANNVVIATGGFEWDPSTVGSFLRGPMTAPVSPPFNKGGGLKLAMKAGARLGNMGEAWWTPAFKIPGDTWLGAERFRAIRNERTRPRSIMVNRAGKRFANEAMNYNSMAQAMQVFDSASFTYPNLPAWLIIDRTHLDKYGYFGASRTGPTPDWMHESPSIAELAEKTGIDGAELQDTIERWNENSRQLRDPDFHRGESAYDGWFGDWAGATIPEQTLGPIENGPFYAVEMTAGALGTKGGPVTDLNGQVIHVDGYPIPGLYAAGNASANVTGPAYPGAGATLSQAMVWAYRAATHAAGGAPIT